jgi:hypothetical protein
LTPAQRDVVAEMGQGSFLNIRCEQLHNPVIRWFVQCYEPARRAFVVPCRGSIPLSEESVHIMTGLPRGKLELKYFADHVLEAEIAEQLFPGGSSRPRVSEIVKMIEDHKEADDIFKKLWMILVVSTVVAPTTDVRISNRCYPMLVSPFSYVAIIIFILLSFFALVYIFSKFSSVIFFLCVLFFLC